MSADISLAVPATAAAPRDNVAAVLCGVLCGLLLPLYLFDESVPLKVALSPAIPAGVVLWTLASRFDPRTGTAGLRLAIATFALAFLASVLVSMFGEGVTVNAFYPFLFMALCLRTPAGTRAFVVALYVSMLGVTLVGWYRFVTLTGGLLDEHALGYWGIKYTSATRNSDALAPMILSALTMIALQRLGAAASAWRRAVLWLGLAVALPALALTFSRGAWIAVALFIVLSSGANWRALLRTALLIGVAGSVMLGLAALVAPDAFASAVDLVALLERVRSIYDPDVQSSNDEREHLLAYALQLGSQHPLFGAGAAQFKCCSAELGYPDLVENLHPENLFLHLFSEYGLLSALAAATILVASAWSGLRSRQAQRHLAGAALVSLIVWLQLNSELTSLFVWTILGVLCSVAVHRAPPAAAEPA